MADRAPEPTPEQPQATPATVPVEQQPDRDGFVTIHHLGTKAEALVKPRSVKTWESRGWTAGPLSVQAKAAAARAGVTATTV